MGNVFYELDKKWVVCDPIIIALHKDVIGLYHPIYTGFDKISWSWAALSQVIITILAFEPYILSCDGLAFRNKYHREYLLSLRYSFFFNIWKESLLNKKDKDKLNRVNQLF